MNLARSFVKKKLGPISKFPAVSIGDVDLLPSRRLQGQVLFYDTGLTLSRAVSLHRDSTKSCVSPAATAVEAASMSVPKEQRPPL
jgi:hypothetical protein